MESRCSDVVVPRLAVLLIAMMTSRPLDFTPGLQIKGEFLIDILQLRDPSGGNFIGVRSQREFLRRPKMVPEGVTNPADFPMALRDPARHVRPPEALRRGANHLLLRFGVGPQRWEPYTRRVASSRR